MIASTSPSTVTSASNGTFGSQPIVTSTSPAPWSSNSQLLETSSTLTTPTLPSITSPPLSVPPQPNTCDYGVMPWCTQAAGFSSGYGCLCPTCVLPSELCEGNKPTNTISCPPVGWLCGITTSDGSVVRSLPPGHEMITSAPSTTLPWWDFIHTLHTTDNHDHTSDAHFSAILKTSTV
jgi:hypothetical protein